MEEDKEVNAMAAINDALAELEPDAAARVLRWAADRYGVPRPTRGKLGSGAEESPDPSEDPGELGEEKTYEQFSEFLDAADPSTEADRVLVAAYWFQVLKGQAELESRALNKELKNTGHGVTHMPHALDDLMNARPRLMVQLKKGATQQAQRKFKLTTEGIKKIKGMLSKTSD